ncbi:hypothetical protein L484_009924 [Morus notabilis]|uniref:RSE1/DDB1/CPSF1 first beta-propeller domain-containing protein n=1 Tax=Morus notabilis TaxID=981085 RepID=W9SF75_9ROSA|nr:hypothetical protein L484_009924 [Morus notabilis]
MSIWNYVVTAHKPTNVTHSCVGNFTSSGELNLIIAKCTRIEIHLLSPQGLQPMLDVPIYGRIATLELFRPHGETQDLLFIATERYKFCVLQWDAETSELITRFKHEIEVKLVYANFVLKFVNTYFLYPEVKATFIEVEDKHFVLEQMILK